jgi:hypothetical protein
LPDILPVFGDLEGTVDFGLKAFKMSELGRKVEPVLEGPQNIRDMIAFCRYGLPAARVVGKQLLGLGIKPADDETKKMIGRWIREIMERQGWTTWRPGWAAPTTPTRNSAPPTISGSS